MAGSGQTNRQKLEQLYEEWARGDYSRGNIFDPEMTARTIGMGDRLTAESYDEFVAIMRHWLSSWEFPLRISAEEFIESGDSILVMVHWQGRGKESGADIDSRGAHLWTFRDGLVVNYDTYRDRDEARAALASP